MRTSMSLFELPACVVYFAIFSFALLIVGSTVLRMSAIRASTSFICSARRLFIFVISRCTALATLTSALFALSISPCSLLRSRCCFLRSSFPLATMSVVPPNAPVLA